MSKASKQASVKVTLALDAATVEGLKAWNRTAYAPGWMLHRILQSMVDELPGMALQSDESLKNRNLVNAYMELAERSTLQDVVRDTGIAELPAKRALEELVKACHLKRDGLFYWFQSSVARAQ